MKKLTLFIVVNIITPLFASAYDFEVDGIYYSITSEANSEVCVTYKESTASDIVYTYSGTIIIPEMVTYGNKSYHVTSIGGAAFNGCINVSSVKLPNSIRTIEYAAFSKTGIDQKYYSLYETEIKRHYKVFMEIYYEGKDYSIK